MKLTNFFYIIGLKQVHNQLIMVKRILLLSLGILCSLVEVRAQISDSSIEERMPDKALEERIQLIHSTITGMWLNYPDSAMEYAKQAYELSLEYGESYYISKSLRLIGAVHYYLGDYDSVIVYSNRSLKIANVIKDSVLINNAYNNIGLAYYNLGSYQNALENLLRSLQMKLEIEEYYGRALTLNNIGLVYNKLKDYNTAREYFEKGFAFARQHSDSNLELYSVNNIGNTYLQEGEYTKAEAFFERGLALNVDNTNWNSVSYLGLGAIYQARGDYEKSQEYLDQSLQLRESIAEKNGIAEVYYYYSKEQQYKQNYDSAVALLNTSQQVALSIGSKERIYENYRLYAEIYEQKGDVQKAYEYQKRLLNLRDTLFSEALAHSLASIQVKINEEENQKKLQIKEKELLINKGFNTFLIIVFVLSMLIAALVFYAYKHIKRINGLLGERTAEVLEQNEEIEAQKESLVLKNLELEKAHEVISQQNEKLSLYNTKLQDKVEKSSLELKSRNEELKLANLELDNFLYKSAHDIKGPLATLMGVCNVAMMDVQEENALKYFKMLLDTSVSLNDILKRLKTLSDINGLELQTVKIDFSDLIQQCVNQVKNIEGESEVNVQHEIDEGFEYSSDPRLIDIIFFNMIQNAVRFKANDRPAVLKIRISKTEYSCDIHFMDNGVGINQEDQKDIFQMFAKTTGRHQSPGLGLYIVKQSVFKLGGDIAFLNTDKEYTHFCIKLPLV